MPEMIENLNDKFGRMFLEGKFGGSYVYENVKVVSDSRPSLTNPNGTGDIDFQYTDADGWEVQKTIPAKAFKGFDDLTPQQP